MNDANRNENSWQCPRFTLRGQVIGTDCCPVPELVIHYTINEIAHKTETGRDGEYCIDVPTNCANVTIKPHIGLGVVAVPQEYSFRNVNRNMNNLNFRLETVRNC